MPPKELVDEIDKAYNEYKKEKEKEVDYLTFYNGFVACNRNRQQENNKLLDVINNQDVKIADLESENAEQKRLRCCENCKNVNLQLHWRESEEIDKRRQFVCGTCGNRKHWEYLGKTVGIRETQQLTKAKELLQHFISMDLFQIAENDQDYNAIEQAEQFIKEIEK